MYSLLIFENNLYFYDISNNSKITINCDRFIKDDKVIDIKGLLNILKRENFIKKLKNKLVGQILNFMYWENYIEADFIMLKECFQELNFLKINFININNILKDKNNHLFLSKDGIHCIIDNLYYSYSIFSGSINNTLFHVLRKYNLTNYILVSNNYIDKHAYRYANVNSFIFDLLKV